MKLRYTLFLVALFAHTFNHAVNEFGWINQLGTNGDDDVKAIASATDGSIFYTGNFSGSLDELLPAGTSDTFLRKVDSNGQSTWTRSFPAQGWAVPAALLVHPENGNVIMAINVSGTIDVDPDAGSSRNVGSSMHEGSVVLCLNSTGDYLWHRYTKSTLITDLCLGVDNSIHAIGPMGFNGRLPGGGSLSVGGLTSSPQGFFQFDGSNESLNIAGNPAAYVLCYSEGGDYLWHYLHQGSGKGFVPISITLGDNNQLFIVGHSISAIEQGHWYDSGSGDPFLLKLTESGNLIWDKYLNQNPGLEKSPVFVDIAAGPQGSLYLAGVEGAKTNQSIGQTVMVIRGGNLLVIKLDQLNGDLIWNYRAHSSGSHTGAYSVTSDILGVSVVGEYYGQIQFDPNDLPQYGQKDAYLVRLNHAGAFQGVFSFGGFGHERVQRMSLSQGFILLGGFFESGFDINPFGEPRVPVQSLGGKDAFLVKYRFDDPSSVFHAHYHPADENRDLRIEMEELTQYAEAVVGDGTWETQPVDFDSMTQANQIWKEGEVYSKSGNQLPADWVVDEGDTQMELFALSGDLAFENVLVGTVANRILNLTNTSPDAVVVTGIELPEGFSGTWSGELIGGQSTDVSILFSPMEERVYGGRLLINTNRDISQDYPVSGVGSPSSILSPIVEFSGDLSYNGAAVGGSMTKILRIRNTGDTSVEVQAMRLPSGFSGSWTGSLDVGNIVAVPIVYSPTTVGTFNGQLEIDTDASEVPQIIPISASSEQPVKSAKLFGNLQYWSVPLGEEVAKPLRIINTGNVPLLVEQVVVPEGYTVFDLPSLIPVGEERTVGVRFSPIEVGFHVGFLGVQTDAPSGLLTYPVQGEGVSVLALSGSLAFGGVAVGDTRSSVLSLRNRTSGRIQINGFFLPEGFTGGWAGSIEAGESIGVEIFFSPTELKDYGGTLGVSSDKGIASRPISGTGAEESRLVSLSGHLGFGSVPVGGEGVRVLKISNLGDSPLTVSGINLPNGFSGSFSGMIEPGMNAEVEIHFIPALAQYYSGMLQVVSDADGGTPSKSVTGRGISPVQHISLSGLLSYGQVPVGYSAQLNFSIRNTGNLPITVSGIAYPSGFSGSWSGVIGPGGEVSVDVSFEPTEAKSYLGEVVVISDALTGDNSIEIGGTGFDYNPQ